MARRGPFSSDAAMPIGWIYQALPGCIAVPQGQRFFRVAGSRPAGHGATPSAIADSAEAVAHRQPPEGLIVITHS